MKKTFAMFKADEKNKSRYLRAHKELDNNEFRTGFTRDRDRILYSKSFRRLEGKTQIFIKGYEDHLRNRLTHTLEVSQISTTISKYLKFNTNLTEAIALGHDVGHTPFGHIGERFLNLITNNCLFDLTNFKVNEHEMGFKHNLQSFKIFDYLTSISNNYKGCNLSNLTLWGILNHSKKEFKKCNYFNGNNKCLLFINKNGKCEKSKNNGNSNKFLKLNHYNRFLEQKISSHKKSKKKNKNIILFIDNSFSWSFEALIVGISDEIAQRHHDIEDGIIAKIIDEKDLISLFLDLFKNFMKKSDIKKLNELEKETNINIFLHDFSSICIKTYINELCKNTSIQLNKLISHYKIKTSDDFYKVKTKIYNDIKINKFKNNNIKSIFDLISYSSDFKQKDKEFQKFLYNKILNSNIVQTMDSKEFFVLSKITKAYLTNPLQLPDRTIEILIDNYLTEHNKNLKPTKYPRDVLKEIMKETDFNNYLLRTIVDTISGMTDNYALNIYKMLYGSKNFWIE